MTDKIYIEIKDTSHGVTDRKKAIKVSNRLAVSWSNSKYDSTFKIFSILSQKPLLKARWKTAEDAIKGANLIEEVYGEYLDILESDPEIDILAVARYSIDGGIEIYDALLELESRQDTITISDMKRAIEMARAK